MTEQIRKISKTRARSIIIEPNGDDSKRVMVKSVLPEVRRFIKKYFSGHMVNKNGTKIEVDKSGGIFANRTDFDLIEQYQKITEQVGDILYGGYEIER